MRAIALALLRALALAGVPGGDAREHAPGAGGRVRRAGGHRLRGDGRRLSRPPTSSSRPSSCSLNASLLRLYLRRRDPGWLDAGEFEGVRWPLRARRGLRGLGPGRRSRPLLRPAAYNVPAHRGLLLRPAGAGRRLLLRPAPGRARRSCGRRCWCWCWSTPGRRRSWPSSGCSTSGSISASGPSRRRLAPKSVPSTGSPLRYRSEDSPWK